MELIRRDSGSISRAQLIARVVVAGLYFTTGPATFAGEWEFTGSVAGELRIFVDTPKFADQNSDTLSPSIYVEPELVYEWNSHNDRMTLVPFLRVDAHDRHRTHADLRQANWLHIATNWDLVVGLDKVFWGVTEARHFVDIINQDDRVEDIDAEDKLGQQMINLNLLRPWGHRTCTFSRHQSRASFASRARRRWPFAADSTLRSDCSNGPGRATDERTLAVEAGGD